MNLLTIIAGGILGFLFVLIYESIRNLILKIKNNKEEQEELEEFDILSYLKESYRILHIRSADENPFDVYMDKCVFYTIKEVKEGWIKLVSEENSGDIVKGKIEDLLKDSVFELYNDDCKVLSCHFGEIQLFSEELFKN